MSLKNSSVASKVPKTLEKNLNHKRIKKIYKNFEKNLNISKKFIVAVSGGPDSLALAFLSKIYSIKKKIDAKFFIVDHKLRKTSTKEAQKIDNVQKNLRNKKIIKKIFVKNKIINFIVV